MMNEDCTIAFRRYREIARATWNLAFAPDAERAVWDCAIAYREAMARLFEALVLIHLAIRYEISLTTVSEMPSRLP